MEVVEEEILKLVENSFLGHKEMNHLQSEPSHKGLIELFFRSHWDFVCVIGL